MHSTTPLQLPDNTARPRTIDLHPKATQKLLHQVSLFTPQHPTPTLLPANLQRAWTSPHQRVPPAVGFRILYETPTYAWRTSFDLLPTRTYMLARDLATTACMFIPILGPDELFTLVASIKTCLGPEYLLAFTPENAFIEAPSAALPSLSPWVCQPFNLHPVPSYTGASTNIISFTDVPEGKERITTVMQVRPSTAFQAAFSCSTYFTAMCTVCAQACPARTPLHVTTLTANTSAANTSATLPSMRHTTPGHCCLLRMPPAPLLLHHFAAHLTLQTGCCRLPKTQPCAVYAQHCPSSSKRSPGVTVTLTSTPASS